MWITTSDEAYMQQHWRICLTPIKTAWVVEEMSTTNMFIVKELVKELEDTIVLDYLGDMAHELQQDLLEVTRHLDLRVLDCSESVIDGPHQEH
ncbi:hypothetical protein V6N13_067825 [Hibiscus sabdariffa]